MTSWGARLLASYLLRRTHDRRRPCGSSARQPEPADAEAYLRYLIRSGRDVGELPILGSPEWCDLDRRDPRSIAAVAVAALAWFLEKHDPDRLRQRLLEDDLLVRVRIKHMIGDLAELPWSRIHEVNEARRDGGDRRYRRPRDG